MFKKLRKLRATKSPPDRTFDDPDFPEIVTHPRVAGTQQPAGTAAPSHPSIVGGEDVSRWIDSLDEAVRPLDLVKGYPRIAAFLLVHWKEWNTLQKYVGGLILNERSDRQGFPTSVVKELVRLQTFIADQQESASLPKPPPHGER